MRTFRFRTHLIAYCTAVTMLLTAAVIVLYSHLFREYAIDSLTDYGRAITMITTFSVADDLITENYAPLQEYVREFSSQAHVDSIQIADNHKKILAASEIRLLGTSMAEDPSEHCISREPNICIAVDSGREQLVVTAPIAVGKAILGRTRVFLSTKPILVHLHEVQMNAALIGLGFWIIAVLFGSFLANRMSEPVHRFVQATDSIRQGDFNVQIPTPKWISELERFAQALHVMVGAIASREMALLDSEKKFRHLFERAMEGIFVATEKGELLDVNPAFISIWGGDSRETLPDRNLFSNLFENNEAFFRFKEQMGVQGYVTNFELILLRNDGSPAIISLTCHVVLDPGGAVNTYEGTIRDITAQKAAEQETYSMRNFLNNIIESMPSSLVTLDHNSVVTQWNTAASERIGIPAPQAIGKNIYEIVPAFAKYSEQVNASSRSRKPVTLYRAHLEDDTDRLYNLTFFPLVANGILGVAVRLDDVTELEQKEQQLRQAQKMESVGTLAGGLAHDFNNVLTSILGNLSLLYYRLDNQPVELSLQEIREYLKNMETAGQRAVDMVRQLLTLSRKQQTELVPVDLNLSIKHVLKIGENTFDKSVQVVVHLSKASAYVLADTTEMEQVLLNLCINAVHAMTLMRGDATWGGILTVVVEHVAADEEFQRTHPGAVSSAYWKVSVSDTGVGMDAQTINKIFGNLCTTPSQNLENILTQK